MYQQNDRDMKKLLKSYKSIIINSVSYENGDQLVKIECEFILSKGFTKRTLLVSQADFNRMMGQLERIGFEYAEQSMNRFYFEDGTQLIEYDFTKSQTEAHIYEFSFIDQVKQLSA